MLSLKNNRNEKENQGDQREKRLLYYLELCRELQTRENARQALAYFEEEVDRLVDDLKAWK
ncbi:MAG: hypothetical protein IAB78_08400 [Bacteroidetes bacterium]|uniref:Uncharacterized protein n=1 Tax=Candidatus Cryptobacteroides excrementavium TaxID=2840759 RepID=A0A9D9NSM0_9BACT|nr:hypothetical protein [Candidatus Cryptobacteroides excrementavium]